MGRLSSFILSLFFAMISASAALALAFAPWLGEDSPWMRIAVVSGAILLAGVIVLLPLGFRFDRLVGELRRFVNAVGEGPPDESELRTPRFLPQIALTFAQWARAMHERERDLTGQLRDMQVRCRIQQTECEQLTGVLHAMRDAVLVTDAFDEIVTMNRSAAEILDCDLEASKRQPVDQVISHARLRDLIRDVRESGTLSESRQVEIDITGNGQIVGYQAMLSTLANNKGEVGAVVTILHDLTREREVAEMKSDFVSKASHELRTPLSSIRAYVEMLVDGEAADEQSRREFYTIIQNETGRLSRLIDNMLNISRIEAGIVQIERQPVDFGALIKRAAESLGPQAAEKKISITTKAAPVDLTAEGDEDMLYQVVLNLISNAIKYTPDGGRVTISADSDNLTRSVVVTVADTGLGIPPDALPRLFEKFFRIENFKRVAKGTGLGLNLCKHIVETVHHGQIGVDSKLGMGSKFWFSVPMRFAGAVAA